MRRPVTPLCELDAEVCCRDFALFGSSLFLVLYADPTSRGAVDYCLRRYGTLGPTWGRNGWNTRNTDVVHRVGLVGLAQ